MATPNEKLAESLDALKALHDGGKRVFRSDDLSRVNRERLVANGFVQEVMRGWLISSSPSARAGESTPWYASFWEFCARYCNDRFGNEWHLSPEQSLLLHGRRTVIPAQVVVNSPKGTNNTINLLFGTSLYDLKVSEMPAADLAVRDGLRLFSPVAALVRVAESFFARNPIEAQVVLGSLADASDLLRLLLNGGHSAKAGYLAGAFRETGRPKLADEIISTMKSAGYDVRESNPFEAGQTFGASSRAAVAERGYWQAFQKVKATVAEVIAGANAGALVRTAHKDWYHELFQPCVAAGLIEAGALAGYRNNPVYLRTSRFVPPRWESVREAIPALFDLLEKETEPGVRAVLGHWLFGYIHPYPDGNGRMARFLMNAMLASGGYPWAVIRVRDRNDYLKALDSASIDIDINPFSALIAKRVRWSLEQHDLRFPEPEERYDFDRGVVMFWGHDGETRVRCAISEEALDDHFRGDDKDKLEVFRANRQPIEQEARRKYLNGETEPDGSVLIRTSDL